MQGTVKKYLDDRGSDFIAPTTGGADVFFRITACVDGIIPSIGDNVEFDLETNPRTARPQAVNVRPV
jgi:cold shock CspA family protein